MLDHRFLQAKNIFQTFEKHGFECYFVGGAVRDYLSNRPIGDIDIATNAKPEDMIRIFPKTVPIGIEHGTVLILDQDHEFEVTTYRIEGDYEDYRHPNDVQFVDEITKDLSRRDFTVNAIAMDLDGNIIDPYHGLNDLEKQIIRTVGNPEDRFNEDPLRMLRGIRFISQLNFQMDENVIQSISQQHYLLKHISVERIADELMKLFGKNHIKRALHLILQTKLDKSLPVFKENPTIMDQLIHIDYNKPLTPNLTIALFHLLKTEITINEWIKAYKLSNQIKNGAFHLVENYRMYLKEGLSNRVLYSTGRNELTTLVQLIKLMDHSINLDDAMKQYNDLPIKSRDELAISGKDLLSWFPTERRGKWVGDYLHSIEKLIINHELENERQAIESTVKKWK